MSRRISFGERRHLWFNCEGFGILAREYCLFQPYDQGDRW